MGGVIQLNDFVGHWQLERKITDHRAGLRGTLRGVADFSVDGDGLLLIERGQLCYGDGTPMQAERRYLWRAEGQGITVYFDDGRRFHWFSAAQPSAKHDCAPDSYKVTYSFGDWPVWAAMWHVTGPRKHYVLESRYFRMT